MFDASFDSCCRWLCVSVHQWTARASQALDRQRSYFPIPPGMGGPTVKLLFKVALPWLAR